MVIFFHKHIIDNWFNSFRNNWIDTLLSSFSRIVFMAVSNFFPNLQISPQFLVPQPFSLGFSRTFPVATPLCRAFREWREYEEAVKRKDLAGALRFLKSLERERQEPLVDGVSPATELARLRFLESERFGPQRDWEVLDTCLNADDMKLVANAYKFLKDRGFLPNFGKCRNIGEFWSSSFPR